jgi:hypothetical protein
MWNWGKIGKNHEKTPKTAYLNTTSYILLILCHLNWEVD